MSSSRIKFCPECEGEYRLDERRCPDDGVMLIEYEIVDEPNADPLTGTRLDGRFRVEEPLSEGGMGKVYRGVQTGVEREVAIKVLRSEAAEDETTIRRFLREARTISQFSHPNVVSFVDFGQDAEADVLYLVMEMIEGCDLSELLMGKRLNAELVTEIGVQVCAALSEPHRAGVVHRDLKPANVMLLTRTDGSLQVKLVDFGIANMIERHDQTRLTETGVACGTPHYMAPEQAHAAEVTEAADAYALGAILFHLLTGRVLFDGATDLEILLKHVREQPPHLETTDIADEVAGDLMELVDRCLTKAPEDRPGSVLELRDALEQIRRDYGYDDIHVDPDRSVDQALDPWILQGDSALPSSTARATTEAADGGGGPPTGETGHGGDGDAQRVADDRSDTAGVRRQAGGEAPGLGGPVAGLQLETWINVGLSTLVASVTLAGVLIWYWSGTEGTSEARSEGARAGKSTGAMAPSSPAEAAADESSPPGESGEPPVGGRNADAEAAGAGADESGTPEADTAGSEQESDPREATVESTGGTPTSASGRRTESSGSGTGRGSEERTGGGDGDSGEASPSPVVEFEPVGTVRGGGDDDSEGDSTSDSESETDEQESDFEPIQP